MDAFTKFAPPYFKYMNDSLVNDASPFPSVLPTCSMLITGHFCQRPTLLAKIFGVYKLGYRSPTRGNMSMNGSCRRISSAHGDHEG